MTTIKFTLEGLKQSFNYIEKEKDYIYFDDILSILQKREIQKSEIEFIKYLNTEYDAWDPININEKLLLNKEKGLKLLIKIKRKVKNEKYNKKKEELMEIMNRIDKTADKILIYESEKYNKSKEEALALNLFNIKPYSSQLISETPDREIIIDNHFYNSESDKVGIIVLTGNPLIDKYDGHEKELKTMNDFNFVTYSIHNTILDCNKQILVKFLPLTLKNFKDAILLRPKILHLICKSTYLSNRCKNEIDKNIINESEIFSPYLLFENNKCEMERINEEAFKKIINLIEKEGGKGILRDISLIISTPLAQDIFEIVHKYPFKNIIVQHTIYTNVPLIAELNEQIYKSIIELDKSIEESFDNAKSFYSEKKSNEFQSCCCFHSHLNQCKLKTNLSNELYNENEKQNLKNYYLIPHFFHLRYKCICPKENFCRHKWKSCDNYQNSFKNLLIKSKKPNICCCGSNDKKHDLNSIFFTYFSKEKDGYGLFSNYPINNFSIVDKAEFVPSYDKMYLIVGRNKIIYNIFELLMENSVEIINIYGSKYEESLTKIDDFIDIIIEFLKERIPYMTSDLNLNINDDSSDILPDKHNSNNISINNNFNSSSNQINIDMKKVESAPLSESINNINPTFEKIAIRKDFQENTITIINEIANDNSKKVYFINAFNINDDDLKEQLKRKEFTRKQIIAFTKNKLGKINEKSIKNIELNELTEIDYTIKLQRLKESSSKEEYDNIVQKTIKENNIIEENFNSVTIIKDNKKAILIYEILFLFHNSISGYFEDELKKLFGNNFVEVKQLLENKYVPKNIIEIEKIEKKEKKEKNEKDYYKYNRKKQIFNKYYEVRKNNIPDAVKQKVFKRLFQFYAMAFRLLIKKAKNKSEDLAEEGKRLKLKKKYKPFDSLTTFSAIQELGIWEPFEKVEQDDDLDIYNIIGYFKHLLKNFKYILKDENIILCYKNKETWERVSNDIEDISITLPTCLKMLSVEQDMNLISLLNDQLKELDRYSHSSLARFELFDYMSFEFNNHNIKYIENLNEIERKFLEYGYKQGILETLFGKCIIKYRESKDFKEFDNEKLKKELNDFENDKTYPMENKSSFIKLFRNKIKYLYYKYKIISGVLSDEDLIELKEMLKAFKSEKKYFCVIKVCFLFSEWYLKKYNFGIRDGKSECQKEKDKHLVYLNLAFYIIKINTFDQYNKNNTEYTSELIKNKYKYILKPSNDMKEEIKKLCNEYSFDYKEDKLKTFYTDK